MVICAEQKQTVEELVIRAKAGDSVSYGELMMRHSTGVRRTIYNILRSGSDVEDLAQDVFIIAQEKLDSLETAAAFTSWIQTIARRTALNALRKRRCLNVCDGLDPADTFTCEPFAGLLDAESSSVLQKGLSRLKPIDRTALELFYLKHHSLLTMSKELHAPVGTVKRRLHVARKRLRSELASYYS